MTEWQQYQDPDGYFSIHIPADWIVQRSADGIGRIGNKITGLEVSFPHIRVLMGPPPLDRTGIMVNFDISATTHPLHRKVLGCLPANTTLDSLPAYHLDNVWMLDKSQAHIRLSYHIPGVQYDEPGSPYRPSDAPLETPVPPDVIASYQLIVDQVIASFRAMPPPPLG